MQRLKDEIIDKNNEEILKQQMYIQQLQAQLGSFGVGEVEQEIQPSVLQATPESYPSIDQLQIPPKQPSIQKIGPSMQRINLPLRRPSNEAFILNRDLEMGEIDQQFFTERDNPLRQSSLDNLIHIDDLPQDIPMTQRNLLLTNGDLWESGHHPRLPPATNDRKMSSPSLGSSQLPGFTQSALVSSNKTEESNILESSNS